MNHPFQHIRYLAACALFALSTMTWSMAGAASLTLTGEQEVPPVITSGNGSGEFMVAPDGAISGRITTHGVPGTMAHIHQGAMGFNGPVIISLVKGEAGVWSVPPVSKLTNDQLAAYRAGQLYVNVHSDTHKGGEIRAQLSP